MRASFAHLLALATSVASLVTVPGLPMVDTRSAGLIDPDESAYYPDANSNIPFNGTVEEYDYDPNDEWDFWDDDTSPADGGLVKRHPNWFTFYRRHWYYRSCAGISNCQDWFLDHIQIHNDCNGGNCKGDNWRETDPYENLCNKSFKSCGKTYQMKYTGKEWSCARLLHFVNKGAHHGKTYANLVRNGKKVGTCKIFTKKRFAKNCDVWAASSFYGQVQCQIY